jgi:nicotinamide riboside transporter PnuC
MAETATPTYIQDVASIDCKLETSMLLKRVIPLMLATYAAWQWTAWLSQRKRQRVATKPLDVTRWEGEGGALPVTGSQIGPDPKMQP